MHINVGTSHARPAAGLRPRIPGASMRARAVAAMHLALRTALALGGRRPGRLGWAGDPRRHAHIASTPARLFIHQRA